MKKYLLRAAILTVAAAYCLTLFAQDHRENKGTQAWTSIHECSTLENLDLSAEQRESLRRIDEDYKARIIRNRNHLMVKRLELQGLLRDPSAGQEAIQAKAGEMGVLRESLQQDMIDYQIRIREILTSDQIKQWCTMMGGTFHGGGWKGDSWCR